MRIAKGKPFMRVPSENWFPDDRCIEEMLDDIKTSDREGFQIPTFSEMYLYPRVGKDDARFILGVAEEYEKLIKILGTEKVLALLAGDIDPKDVS